MACGYCHAGPGNVRTCECAEAQEYQSSCLRGGAARNPIPKANQQREQPPLHQQQHQQQPLQQQPLQQQQLSQQKRSQQQQQQSSLEQHNAQLVTTEEVVVRDAAHAHERPAIRVRRRRVSQDERNYIWEQSCRRCYICKTSLPRGSSWHVEHVVAFSTDPARNDVRGNMLAACATCNLKKLDRPLVNCVQEFACDLDTAAAEASHLNTVARGDILCALKLKRRLYQAYRPENYASAVNTVLDAIEKQMSRSVKVAAERTLPRGEVQFNEEMRPAHGSYGDVYRGKWRQAGAAEVLDVAIKFSRRSIGGRGSVLTGELEALRKLTRHDHIVRFLGIHPHTWTTGAGAGDADHGLVFEWCDFHLKSRCVVQNANLVELVAQVADALDFLHRQQPKPYIHRDVKPLNILVHKRRKPRGAMRRPSWPTLASRSRLRRVSSTPAESARVRTVRPKCAMDAIIQRLMSTRSGRPWKS